MRAAERAALESYVDSAEEMTSIVDDRTLAILERRRRTAVIRRRGWLLRRLFLAADLFSLAAALAISEWSIAHWKEPSPLRIDIALYVLLLPIGILLAATYGLYKRDVERADHSTVDDLPHIFHMITVGAAMASATIYLTGIGDPPFGTLVLFWTLALVFLTASRAGARGIARRNLTYLQNALIVGAGEVGQLIGLKLLQHPEYGINVVGFIDSEPRSRDDRLEYLTVLGGPERLGSLVRLLDIERVIVAFSNESRERLAEIVSQLRDLDVQVDIVPRLFETIGPSLAFYNIEGLPLLRLPLSGPSFLSRGFKRAADIVLAAAGLIVLAPVLLVIAAAVRLTSRGPALYRHGRVGYRGRPIDVLKFRTMYLEACRGERYGGEAAEREFALLMEDPLRAAEFAAAYKLSDDPRLTRVGRFLRGVSLDELPQLINVLRGDLSLVGPRPVTEDELSRYGDNVPALLAVRPGLTGYWQINGRSSLDYADRVRLDLAYLSTHSLRVDLAILAKTIRVVVRRGGAH